MRECTSIPHWVIAGLCCLCVVPQLQGQTNPSTAPPGKASSVDQQGLALKTEVRQVIVDVVITTDRDEPVKHLPRSVFRVTEDGKPQDISFFEEHSGVASDLVRKAPPEPANVYTNIPNSPVTDSINVLLLDALNTPMQNQAYVRQQMVSYLKSIPAGTRLAIFTLSSRLRMIQGFTDDPALLVAAINTPKTLPHSSPLLDPVSDADDLNVSTGAVAALLQQFEADTQSFQTDMRVRYTLDAFQQLGRYLSAMPGRKNIIWFSGSFPLGILPDSALDNPFQATRSYTDDVKKTADLLAGGQIAIYPVDARGLMTLPMFSASSSGRQYAANPSAMGRDAAKFFQQTAEEHAAMNQLARETGGEAIYNTNGLKEAIARVLNDGSNYYTLAYTPAERKQDGRFRKVEIKLDGYRYKLSYRRGYLADDLGVPQVRTSALSPDPFLDIMRRGAPQMTQILFKARVLPAAPQPDTSDPAKRQGEGAARLKGPVVRYSIDYAADIGALNLSLTPDGIRRGLIRFAAVGFDEEGTVLNSAMAEARLTVPQASYDRLLLKGLQFHQELDLPRGEVFLRIGVYDPAHETMGSLELPVMVRPEKSNIKPAAAAK